MMRPLDVHALLYTGTCHDVLMPVIERMVGDERFNLSVTALPPGQALSYWSMKGRDWPHVSNDASALARFVSTGGKKVLLLVADWTHPAHRMGFNAVKQARHHGIPSLSVQHGVFSLLQDDSVYLWDFTSDLMAVWGRWFADALIKCGKGHEDQLVVTGSPRFMTSRSESREDVLGALGIDPAATVGMVAMSLNGFEDSQAISMVSSALRALDSRYDAVIVRPHPGELLNGRIALYVEAAKRSRVPVVYSSPHRLAQPDLMDLLDSIDCLVTQASTVGLFAAAKGVPVISIAQPEGRADGMRNPYPDGVVYRSVPFSTVRKGLTDVMADVPTKREIAERCDSGWDEYFEPGDAVARIIEEIVWLGSSLD